MFTKTLNKRNISATWYSTHKCSTLLRFNCENGVFTKYFYFLWGQYMCGLTAFGTRTLLVLSEQYWIKKRTVVKTVELTWVVYHVAEPKVIYSWKFIFSASGISIVECLFTYFGL
jgi:hypothetical protein